MKDSRIKAINHLITTNYITKFNDIFDHIPVTLLVKLFKTNSQHFHKFKVDPAKFTFEQVFKMAAYLEIEESKMIELVHKQVIENRKKKTKKPG